VKRRRLALLAAAAAALLAFVTGADALAQLLTAELVKPDGRALDDVAFLSSAAAIARLEETRTGRELSDSDHAVRETEARLLRRAGRWVEAVRPAREAARLAPARARAQAILAVSLLDAAAETKDPVRESSLRAEGERRLALALELGPFHPNLQFTAGSYWLDRAALTNQRQQIARAREHLARAVEQDPDLRRAASNLIEARLRAGRLASFADELRAAFPASLPEAKNP
jgi:hypothetical protein